VGPYFENPLTLRLYLTLTKEGDLLVQITLSLHPRELAHKIRAPGSEREISACKGALSFH